MSENRNKDGQSDRPKPSRSWYLLAVAVIFIGGGAFWASIVFAQDRVDAIVGSMQRVVVPGSAEMTFTQPGDYLVYYEKIGTYLGEDFDTTGVFREAPLLDIDVQHTDTGEYVEVRQAKYDQSQSQVFNHGRANSEFIFTLPPEHFLPTESNGEQPAAAKYVVTAAHENVGLEDRVLLAVGPPVVGSMMSDWKGPFGGAALLAFAFVISVTTFLVTWTLRNGTVTRRDD
ncbi:MAG: hypothetical protein AAGH99_15675 [Planctomycetota bacterium]